MLGILDWPITWIVGVPLVAALAVLQRRRWWLWALLAIGLTPVGAGLLVLLVLPPPIAPAERAFLAVAPLRRPDPTDRGIAVFWGLLWLGGGIALLAWSPKGDALRIGARVVGCALLLAGRHAAYLGLFPQRMQLGELRAEHGRELDRVLEATLKKRAPEDVR